jgi:CheY-like chemotaxis protein
VAVEAGPHWILGDPVRLEQVFANLLRNSVKFTDAGGRIEAAVRREGESIVAEVIDDGVGIAPADLSRIFGLFAQGELTRGRPSDGLGIGLTLVKSLTELLGGDVRAFSEGPGRGSRFQMRFPAVPAPTPPEVGEAPAPEPPGRGIRLLLVDDNAGMVRAMAELLRHAGHEALLAFDGRSALAIAEASPPDLILLDMELPDMEGHEVARRLRGLPPCRSTPIAAMSGHSRDPDPERSRRAGFVEHLVKPVRYTALSGLIERVLAGSCRAEVPAGSVPDG